MELAQIVRQLVASVNLRSSPSRQISQLGVALSFPSWTEACCRTCVYAPIKLRSDLESYTDLVKQACQGPYKHLQSHILVISISVSVSGTESPRTLPTMMRLPHCAGNGVPPCSTTPLPARPPGQPTPCSWLPAQPHPAPPCTHSSISATLTHTKALHVAACPVHFQLMSRTCGLI